MRRHGTLTGRPSQRKRDDASKAPARTVSLVCGLCREKATTVICGGFAIRCRGADWALETAIDRGRAVPVPA
jgi:hypothetical protein